MRADHKISFMPVAPEHYALLRGWLERPHMREWWGDPETELGYIRNMVEGRDTTRPFLIISANEPVGYIQYWLVGHQQNQDWVKDHPWLAELPSDAVGVDLSIGEPEKLSAGLGSAALSAFVGMLRANGHATIIIDPDSSNMRAVRAYEKAGFRPVASLIGRTGDTLIMQYDVQMEAAA